MKFNRKEGVAAMVEFWHGSRVRLPTGTRLEPLRERSGDRYSEAQFQYMADYAFDSSRVYFTTDRELARAWCARDTDGAVLRVEPVGAVEPDPDYPNTSFSAVAAVVLDVVEHPVVMGGLAARKAFAAYEPEAYDKRGFIRPEVRLPEMFVASGCDGLAFRREGGRYPNPMRFSLRAGRVRYLTDDNELLLARRLAELSIPLTDAQVQAELAHARAVPWASHPIRWL